MLWTRGGVATSLGINDLYQFVIIFLCVAGSLAGQTSISAVMCTQEQVDKLPNWLALRTNDTFANPEKLNATGASFVAQLAF